MQDPALVYGPSPTPENFTRAEMLFASVQRRMPGPCPQEALRVACKGTHLTLRTVDLFGMRVKMNCVLLFNTFSNTPHPRKCLILEREGEGDTLIRERIVSYLPPVSALPRMEGTA